MLLSPNRPRLSALLRLVGLGLISLSVFNSRHAPGTHGRGLVVAICYALATVSWLVWTGWSNRESHLTADLWVMAAAGGVLTGAATDTASSAFVFIAVAAATIRVELPRAAAVIAVGTLALAASVLVYNDSGLGLLAYALGFAAAGLGGSNSRQSVQRAEQAELLLAQSQRSHEEQLRSARLEESARIAREIHDVLAHALAGLTIQLEATSSLLRQGADRDDVLARVDRAHELAREGLRETRRAVGALRGEVVPAPAAIEALVDDYRASTGAPASLAIDGDPERLTGSTGAAVLRVAQEALTNIRKHAPGAAVAVAVHAGQLPDEEVVLVVDNRRAEAGADTSAEAGAGAGDSGAELASSGGGYGLRGMRERAYLLGGTVMAGPADNGWRVELRLPAPAGGTPRTGAALPATSGEWIEGRR